MVLMISRLNFTMICIAVALLITAAATASWGCGNLYAHCYDAFHTKSAALATLIFFSLGLALFVMVVVFELLSCCVDSIRISAGIQTARIVLLFLGVASLVIALCLFTHYMAGNWSYAAALVGTTLASQVAILTAMHSHCVTTRTETRMAVPTHAH